MPGNAPEPCIIIIKDRIESQVKQKNDQMFEGVDPQRLNVIVGRDKKEFGLSTQSRYSAEMYIKAVVPRWSDRQLLLHDFRRNKPLVLGRFYSV